MLAIFNLGGGEIILILAIVLILFGAKSCQNSPRAWAKGIKEFKKATHNASEGMREALEENFSICAHPFVCRCRARCALERPITGRLP